MGGRGGMGAAGGSSRAGRPPPPPDEEDGWPQPASPGEAASRPTTSGETAAATGKVAAAVGTVPLRGGTYSGAEARNARDGVATGTRPRNGMSAGDAGAPNGVAEADGAATDEPARGGSCGTGGGGAECGAERGVERGAERGAASAEIAASSRPSSRPPPPCEIAPRSH